MKPAQVNKLYSKLTPEQQAALVIEYAAKKDFDTVDEIISHVERKTYSDYHADYMRRSHGLLLLAGNYGIEYWKNRALMLYALWCMKGKESKVAAEFEETIDKYFDKATALESALIEICQRLGIDMLAIKEIAGVSQKDILTKAGRAEDAELVKQYIDEFTSLILG